MGLQSKVWTAIEPVKGLSFDLSGRVFVHRSPSHPVAMTITLMSDSQALLDVIQPELSSDWKGRLIVTTAIRLPPNSNVQIDANLLAHVVVREPLSYVSSEAELVLHDGALASTSDESVTLKANDRGCVLYNTSASMELHSLSLDANDDATIQILTPQLSITDDITLKANDGGSVGIQSRDLAAHSLTSSADDGGSIFVASDIRVALLDTDIKDDGQVNLYPRGTCDDSSVKVSDSGNANLGSIACGSVDAKISDDGRIIVQALNTLETHVSDNGVIKFYNTTPLSFSSASGQSKRRNAQFTSSNPFNLLELKALPLDVPTHVQILSLHGDGPLTTITRSDTPEHAFQTDRPLPIARHRDMFDGLWLVVLFIVLFMGNTWCKPPKKTTEAQPLMLVRYQ
ncbi:unnamed protein product [Aphanomyces euteiches]